MMLKIMHQLIGIPTDTILHPAPTYHHLRGHIMKLLQPNSRINAYLHSFFSSAIKIWNNLPDNFNLSLEQFKKKSGKVSNELNVKAIRHCCIFMHAPWRIKIYSASQCVMYNYGHVLLIEMAR